MTYTVTATLGTRHWWPDIGSSVVVAREAELQQLQELYIFREPTVIRQFLRTHSPLIEVLFEAWPHLHQHFGPDLQVALEVVSDPEVENWDELFAYVLTPLLPDEALVRLNNFDQDWFLDQLDRVDGTLNFDVEFV